MPVELTEREPRDTLAVPGEWDDDGAQAAHSALEWLCWEGEGEAALEPPDTELLTWGQVMGYEEASAREDVATAIDLCPGAAGFPRRLPAPAGRRCGCRASRPVPPSRRPQPARRHSLRAHRALAEPGANTRER
jgi:hypothetical protein